MDKVLIVTGGGRGIGAATALLCANQGYAVCVNYKENKEAADTVVERIRSEGGHAIAVAADVSLESGFRELFGTVDDKLGKISSLVNNAGILERQIRVEDVDVARLQRILSANVVGPLLCAREAVRRMSKKHGGQGGAIVNVSSSASRLGLSGEYVDYAASKGEIDTLTTGFSQEVAGEEVRFNAVRPVFIYTNMHSDGGEPERVDRIK